MGRKGVEELASRAGGDADGAAGGVGGVFGGVGGGEGGGESGCGLWWVDGEGEGRGWVGDELFVAC